MSCLLQRWNIRRLVSFVDKNVNTLQGELAGSSTDSSSLGGRGSNPGAPNIHDEQGLNSEGHQGQNFYEPLESRVCILSEPL